MKTLTERVKRQFKEPNEVQKRIIDDVEVLERSTGDLMAVAVNDYAICFATELIDKYKFTQDAVAEIIEGTARRYDTMLQAYENKDIKQ